jgi:hypothetical protein
MLVLCGTGAFRSFKCTVKLTVMPVFCNFPLGLLSAVLGYCGIYQRDLAKTAHITVASALRWSHKHVAGCVARASFVISDVQWAANDASTSGFPRLGYSWPYWVCGTLPKYWQGHI